MVELPNMQSNQEWKFYPSVFLANAIAAFALNLVRIMADTSFATYDIASWSLPGPLTQEICTCRLFSS